MKKFRLFALALAALLLLACIGCSASSKSAAYDTAISAPQYAMTEEGKYEMPAEEPAAAEAESVTTAGYDSADEISYDESVSDYTAKIIYSANLSLQTTEFDEAVAALERMTASFGGFVERSDVTGDISYESDGSTRVVNRWGYYTLRIPCARFEEFLTQTQGLGNVISSSKYAENVTSSYTDYEARLSSLYTQEERLLSMLEKSEDVDSLIALEQRLADVRYEIESIERNLRNLDMQISYSTVSVDLQEVEVYTPTAPVQRTFGEKLSDAFASGWRGFTRGLQRFAIGMAEALPTLIILAVIVVACIILVRRLVKKHRTKKQPPEQNDTQQP